MHPEKSDRSIAKITKVSHPTVAAVRRDLEKTGDVEIASTRTDSAGRRYIDPALAQKLALAEFDGAAKSPVERLSDREFEVFVRLAGGATVQRIAADLNLSASTIGTHLYNIKQKLGVANQSELTLIAIRHGLIEA